MKSLLLVTLSLFASYASAATYTCPAPWVYVESDGQCHKVMPNYSADDVKEMLQQEQLKQQQPVVINNILPKVDPVDEIKQKISHGSSTTEDEDGNNDKELSEEGMKKQIGKLLKRVMIASATRAINEQQANIRIATPNVIGNVELGKSTIGVGSGGQALNVDTNEGFDSIIK